jgi:hypothetical protein
MPYGFPSQMSTARTTAAQVALTTKLFYRVESVAEGTKNTALKVFLLFYYIPGYNPGSPTTRGRRLARA